MNHKVGIWIDHRKAVIVSALAERLTSLTLESDVGPHARYSERAGYYDEVIRQLGQPDALLIFGPGDAKLQFQEHLTQAKSLLACDVGVETTESLTDPQIVAKVRQHYGIVPPGSGAPGTGAYRGRQ